MSLLEPKPLVAAAIAAGILAVMSCSSSTDTPGPTPTGVLPPIPTATPVNPRALLDASGRVMEGLDSFYFRLTHRSGATPLAGNLVIDEAEGAVVKPDRISAEFSGSFGGFAINSGLITLGDLSFMTNPLTRKWESVPPEVSPLGFFDPRRGIAAIMSRIVDPTILPGGDGVYRVAGRLPAEALRPLLGSALRDATVDVVLTLDAEALYLLEAVIDGRVTPAEEDGVVRVITLSRFNEPFAIEPPL